MYIYIYIHIYVNRERERERDMLCSMCVGLVGEDVVGPYEGPSTYVHVLSLFICFIYLHVRAMPIFQSRGRQPMVAPNISFGLESKGFELAF